MSSSAECECQRAVVFDTRQSGSGNTSTRAEEVRLRQASRQRLLRARRLLKILALSVCGHAVRERRRAQVSSRHNVPSESR